MDNLAEIAPYVGVLLYASLAVIAWRIQGSRRSPASGWVLATFGVLFALSVATLVLPEPLPPGFGWLLTIKLVIVGLLAFPYLMHRFADALSPAPRWLRRTADAGLLLLGAATILLPELYDDAEAPAWFTAYGLVFVLYWGLLFTAVAWRLFRAGRAEPTLVRRRIRLLAGGSLLMGLALVVSFAIGQATGDDGAAGSLVSTLFGMASAALFLLGFAPPGVLRVAWREPEEAELQEAATELLAATSREQVTDVLLPHLASIVGARGVVLRDARGRAVATHGQELAGADADAPRLRVTLRRGEIVGRTSPYAPFLGEEEERLFRRLGVMADLALERVELLERLRDANVALEEANQELESFVYSASHDLKNPLIALLGYLDILKTDYAGHFDDEGRWYLERMTTNGLFMESLIQDLLELSRVGRMEVESTEVDLAPLLHDLRDDLRSRHPHAVVTIGPLPRLHVNATRARQLFANILENAAKYGGRPDVRIDVSAEPTPSGARVVVADDGVGIPDEYRERVFGVFERLDPDDTKSQGTGIGLAICRKIAETYGGRIQAAPSSDGARIVIDLPDDVVLSSRGADAEPSALEARP